MEDIAVVAAVNSAQPRAASSARGSCGVYVRRRRTESESSCCAVVATAHSAPTTTWSGSWSASTPSSAPAPRSPDLKTARGPIPL